MIHSCYCHGCLIIIICSINIDDFLRVSKAFREIFGSFHSSFLIVNWVHVTGQRRDVNLCTDTGWDFCLGHVFSVVSDAEFSKYASSCVALGKSFQLGRLLGFY